MKNWLLPALAAGWATVCFAQQVPLRETAPLKAGGLQYFDSQQLPDGDVLVFGGSASLPNVVNGVWRYDWQTETWSAFSPLAFPAAQTVSVRLSSGDILCIGGTNNFSAPLQKSQLLRLSTMQWTESTGNFSFWNPVYTRISALTLPGDYVLLTSTNGNFSVYDPATQTWSNQQAPAPLDAGGSPMVWLNAQGEVLWCGAGGQIFQPAAIPTSGNLFYLNPAQPLFKDGVTRLTDGSVLTMNLELSINNTVTRYDPVSRTATAVTTVPFNAGVDTRSAVLMPDGKVLTFGFGNIASPGNTKVIEVYDPETNSWQTGMYSEFGPFRAPRMHVLPDSSVFAISTQPEPATGGAINRCWILNRAGTTAAEDPATRPAIRVWPNPAGHWLQVDGLDGVAADLLLYHPDGKLTLSRTVIQGRISWPEGQLVPGLYFYQIRAKEGQILSDGKILLR